MSFVITGSPGVGKHTITKEISRLLNLPVFDINEIAKEGELFEKMAETNEVDVEKLERIIKEKILYPSIIVGHLAPYVLTSDQIKKVIVLRKNPYDLIPIYKNREYSNEKIKDNIGSEVLGVILYDTITKFGTDKTIQVDITGKSIEESTKIVMDGIKGKVDFEEIDWLSVFSEKNDLKEFFAY
ncbi:MAG: adenylate kinase family protein [Nitrosopumilaceae archaeon]